MWSIWASVTPIRVMMIIGTPERLGSAEKKTVREGTDRVFLERLRRVSRARLTSHGPARA